MNHGEGYTLTQTEDTGEIEFRIIAKKYSYVRGTLQGSPEHMERLRTALSTDEWRVGPAEVVTPNREHELNINVTNETVEIDSKHDAETFIGADINEDCIALAALTEEDIVDSIVIECPEIKKRRHECFTIRKRMQSVGQITFETTVQDQERRFVHDQLRKVSHTVVE